MCNTYFAWKPTRINFFSQALGCSGWSNDGPLPGIPISVAAVKVAKIGYEVHRISDEKLFPLGRNRIQPDFTVNCIPSRIVVVTPVLIQKA